MRVVLDIGHGENTFPPSKGVYLSGHALSATNGVPFEEHSFNSRVGVLTREKLKNYDVEVLFTQGPNAPDVPLAERIRKVREWHSKEPIDLLVSIHANAHYVGSPANGFESFYWTGKEKGREFCRIWHSKMNAHTGLKDRGIKVSSPYGNNWYIVRNAPCTAVLLEHFFYTNYAELTKCREESAMNGFAEILASTIWEHLRLSLKETQPDKVRLSVVIDGEEREFEAVPINGRNFVSVRELAESLGYAVEWNPVTKKVIIMKGERV